jgi:hypothetical protein
VIVAFLTLISACPGLIAANVKTVENPKVIAVRILSPLIRPDLQFEEVRL